MNQIKHYRELAGLTRKELAAIIGVHFSAVGHYEDGRRAPSLEMSRKLVAVLNKRGTDCSLDDVFPPSKPKKRVAA